MGFPAFGSIKSFADVKIALDRIRGYFIEAVPGGDVRSGTTNAHDSNLVEYQGPTGKQIKDGGLKHADVAAAIALLSGPTMQQGWKDTVHPAEVDKLNDALLTLLLRPNYVDPRVEELEDLVATLLNRSRTLGLADIPSGIDHGGLAGLTDDDHTQYVLVDNTRMATGTYRYAAALADGDSVTLPTITANFPAHGFIHCAHASTGVISESAEFEFGSTGEVQLIRGSANIEAGGATAGKISLGPVADANPVVIKNNLGGGISVNVLIALSYA